MLTIKKLKKNFNRCTAVNDISFSLKKGGITGFLGPNGAGKTTTIRMMSGLLIPTAGAIEYNNKNISEDMNTWKTTYGIVPEELLLFDRLSLYEHIQLAGSMYNIEDKETRQRAEDLLEFLNLWDSRDIHACEASTGMRKKTAIAMALIHTPKVLILDEVFAGIDPVSIKGLRELFFRLSEKGVTIFFSSHTLEVVEQIAEHVIIIVKGSIALDMAMKEMAATYGSLESGFFTCLGNPEHHVSKMQWLL
jgi:ABC-2 type transport system ATP-binding protein